MGLFSKSSRSPTNDNGFKIVVDEGEGYYSWDGRLYKSDIVRSCIRPKAKAVGKLVGQHLRTANNKMDINPDVNIKFLLEEPNKMVTMQKMLERAIVQLELNNNAYIYIQRNDDGKPTGLYNIYSVGVEAKYNKLGAVFLKFTMKDGKIFEVPYSDVIHLRQDLNENEIFGSNPTATLTSLMEVVNTTDQGIVKYIKNNSVVKWILNYKQTTNPDSVDKDVNNFVEKYLKVNSKSAGVIAGGNRYDINQVKHHDVTLNASQMDRVKERFYDFFGTNKKIIQTSYNEDEWNSYYESQIEVIAKELSDEFTRKLFTRIERNKGNVILFSSISLQYASMTNKLQLLQMVDRGAMTPNEWRKVMNLPPIEGGDKPIRRLDTAVVENNIIELKQLVNELASEIKNQASIA